MRVDLERRVSIGHEGGGGKEGTGQRNVSASEKERGWKKHRESEGRVKKRTVEAFCFRSLHE